jgi:hypothetical protein
MTPAFFLDGVTEAIKILSHQYNFYTQAQFDKWITVVTSDLLSTHKCRRVVLNSRITLTVKSSTLSF